MTKAATNAKVNQELRDEVFNDLMTNYSGDEMEFNGHNYVKINDRQYGCILTDLNGNQRYVRIGVVVAALREDMTAQELMASEIEEYEMKQKVKEMIAKAKEANIAKDKERREKEKEEKEND